MGDPEQTRSRAWFSERYGVAVWAASLCLVTASAPAQTKIEIQPLAPGLRPEGRIHATVDGQELPLVGRRVWHADSAGEHYMEVAAARFAAGGPAKVICTAGANYFGEAVMRSLAAEIPLKHSGAVFAFELPGPGDYYLRLPGLAGSNGTFTVAFFVDDLAAFDQVRARLSANNDANVANQGVRPDPELDQTAPIQRLLDRGGSLWFPPGVYRSGTLHVRSDTTVCLAPGAVLRASDKQDAVGPEFIAVENATHVKLCGWGIIDAHSLSTHRRHGVHNVNITSSRDVTIENLLLDDSNSWAVHIRRSDRFTARNVKVFSGKDGFDPDSSRDVTIEGAFVVSADDAIAVKNRFPQDADGKTTERVTFRNSIVTTPKSALKIGTETRGPIRDVTFENCEVFDGDRGIVLYARDGGPIERVAWRNIRLSMIDWPQEKASGTVFDIGVVRREAPTPVRDCLIENITANWIYRSDFAGLPEARLDSIRMRDIRVKAETPKSGRPFLFQCGDNVRITIERLNIDWQGNQRLWAGVASGNCLVLTGSTNQPDTETSKQNNK